MSVTAKLTWGKSPFGRQSSKTLAAPPRWPSMVVVVVSASGAAAVAAACAAASAAAGGEIPAALDPPATEPVCNTSPVSDGWGSEPGPGWAGAGSPLQESRVVVVQRWRLRSPAPAVLRLLSGKILWPGVVIAGVGWLAEPPVLLVPHS